MSMTRIRPPEVSTQTMARRPRLQSIARGATVLVAILSTGCAAMYEPYTSQPAPPTRTMTSATEQATATAPPTTQVYVYPSKGQSAQQVDRDRYECYRWAVAQTGFDPSLPALAPHQRVDVIPAPPPGTGTVAGAVTGAALGAVVSERGRGAVVGAVVGGLIGSASDAARVQRAQEAQRRHDQRDDEQLARLERQSNDYRRALTACLEGRGYTVK